MTQLKTEMSNLKPDDKGFRYILMWMDHLIKKREDAGLSYLAEWADFVRDSRDAMSKLKEENANLTTKCNHIMTEHGELLKEVEKLRDDSERLDYIIENCMTDGGGDGFTLTIKFDTDTECIKHAIDVSLAAAEIGSRK